MKILGTMNGWRLAPHCWRYFLTHPLRVERTPAWVSIGLFGFVVFLGLR